MTTTTISTQHSFAATATDLCQHFGISWEWIEDRGAFGLDLPTSAANANTKKRAIQAPYPDTVSSFAIVLHEIGEIEMASAGKKGEARSWAELRATKFAREAARKLGYGEDTLDAIDYRLGRALSGYLAHDLEEGKITREEIAARVPSELLPYAERLGVEVERGFVPEPWGGSGWPGPAV